MVIYGSIGEPGQRQEMNSEISVQTYDFVTYFFLSLSSFFLSAKGYRPLTGLKYILIF
jgi:hypothetical protein